MENLGEGKLSGLSALPEETHQHRKMPFPAVIAVVPKLVEGSSRQQATGGHGGAGLVAGVSLAVSQNSGGANSEKPEIVRRELGFFFLFLFDDLYLAMWSDRVI